MLRLFSMVEFFFIVKKRKNYVLVERAKAKLLLLSIEKHYLSIYLSVLQYNTLTHTHTLARIVIFLFGSITKNGSK